MQSAFSHLEVQGVLLLRGLFTRGCTTTDMSLTWTNSSILNLSTVGSSRSAKGFQRSVVVVLLFFSDKKTVIVVWNVVQSSFLRDWCNFGLISQRKFLFSLNIHEYVRGTMGPHATANEFYFVHGPTMKPKHLVYVVTVLSSQICFKKTNKNSKQKQKIPMKFECSTPS